MVQYSTILMLIASATPGQLITYRLILLVLVILITGGICQVHERAARVIGRDDLMLVGRLGTATDPQRIVGWHRLRLDRLRRRLITGRCACRPLPTMLPVDEFLSLPLLQLLLHHSFSIIFFLFIFYL